MGPSRPWPLSASPEALTTLPGQTLLFYFCVATRLKLGKFYSLGNADDPSLHIREGHGLQAWCSVHPLPAGMQVPAPSELVPLRSLGTNPTREGVHQSWVALAGCRLMPGWAHCLAEPAPSPSTHSFGCEDHVVCQHVICHHRIS